MTNAIEFKEQAMSTAIATIEKVHPFEKAGLGKAPFQYVGMVYQEISHGQRVVGSVGGCEMTTKPGGSCAFCGKYIVNMFDVESADGHRFHVGCDCIRKVGDVVLTKKVNADVKKMKAKRESDRIAEARRNLPQAYSLRSQPHPTPYLASEGKTMAGYCEWLLANSGPSGKLRAARMIELSIAQRVEE